MACYAFGKELRISAEEAASLLFQNHLSRPAPSQNVAWSYILIAVVSNLSIEAIHDFKHKHQIPDASLKVPTLQILPLEVCWVIYLSGITSNSHLIGG